ncbi:helix-turn-helix domain-containing protein [Streptomyces alboniger]|uniref:helix-turn-helix domain-containing protein n=1 Tax=Streptomyces alboniger TaxID=132473 RepID=UPI00123CA334|nr:helix-turn-helix domain-containing protein [Streptomyces alboniger]
MDRVNVRVSRHPGATLFSLLKDIFGGHSHGVPRLWRDAVRRVLPADAAAVVGPLLRSRACWIPDRLALVHDLDASDMNALLEELAGIDPALVAAEVAAFHSVGSTPPEWRTLLDQPVSFLAAYRSVASAAWHAFAPLWREADLLMGREAERVGVAAVTGGLDGLLAGLDADVRYRAGALQLPHPCPTHLADLGGRPLVLVPLASGYTARMYSADRDDALWIAYPVPGLGRIAGRHGGAEQKTGTNALSLVLGPVRARILRHVPHRPAVGDLARQLHIGVSTVTYHCQQLEATGLLQRVRHGREVRLHPTERGTALTHLLAAAPIVPGRDEDVSGGSTRA